MYHMLFNKTKRQASIDEERGLVHFVLAFVVYESSHSATPRETYSPSQKDVLELIPSTNALLPTLWIAMCTVVEQTLG